MNLLKKFVGINQDPETAIPSILPLSTAEPACDPSSCHNTYPANCFKLTPPGSIEPLWETVKPLDVHILVSTGKTDWEHDPFEKSGTLLNKIQSFTSGSAFEGLGMKAKMNVTNSPLSDKADFEKYSNGEKCDVLLMPFFVWLKGIDFDNCDAVMLEVLQMLKNKSELPDVSHGVEIVKDLSRSYVLLCSHRTRDKKCGVTAPFMKREFDSQLRDLDLYRDFGDSRRDGVNVVFVNHLGGHKFAANVLVYNKGGEFAWFARCSPLNVGPIVQETVLNGKVFPKLVRGVQKFDGVSW